MTPVPSTDVLVVVVGSVNLDIVIELDTVPDPGQTVIGRDLSEHGGGKGGNQAVAAARLAPTALLGAVGDDAVGDQLVGDLVSKGVNVGFLERPSVQSGRAFVTLTPDGENRIIVLPGSNRFLEAHSITEALDSSQPTVVITQQEISIAAVETTATWAVANSKRFLLNASPVREVSVAVLAAADPLIVNAEEARDILGAPAETGEAVLAEGLLRVSRSAILTAGKRGAYVAAEGRVRHIEAQRVNAVDTTGAGDEFAGTVAAALALGESLAEATARATAASGRLVQLARERR